MADSDNKNSLGGGWKSTALIVLLILNFIALGAFVLGGMKWITEINMSVAVLSERQIIVLKTIKDLQDFDIELIKRHAIEDAMAGQKKPNGTHRQ